MPGLAPPTDDYEAAEAENLSLDERKATRNLLHGLIALAILVLLVIGLILAVPGLHQVGHEIDHMAFTWVALAVVLEVLSCVGYIIAFLQVFERAPIRFGARVALSELAFGAAVSLGGAGSIAVGAWLLVERGLKPARVAERSAVLFLLTSAINVLTLGAAGLAVWFGLLPGTNEMLLSLVPGCIGLLVFLAFLALPPISDRITDGRSGRAAQWMRVTSETIRATERVLFRWDWRVVGAIGYLWFDIAVLWVCFEAIGHPPPLAVVILAYQIGYLSNLVPIPGGIGVLDGSFVGMFVLYSVGATVATSATIVYHAISLWIPATWGTISFILLRRSRNEPLELRATMTERREARRARRAEQRQAAG